LEDPCPVSSVVDIMHTRTLAHAPVESPVPSKMTTAPSRVRVHLE
jgi:hypothetical protein